MLRLHQIFYANFLVLFFATLILSSFVSYFAIKNIEINNFHRQLENTISMVELIQDGKTSLEAIVTKIYNDTEQRVTIIDSDGKVLADGNAEVDSMDNHFDREEIQEAIETEGIGDSIRYSATLKTDFLYVAKKSRYKNHDVFIRTAIPVGIIMHDFYSLWVQLIAIFAVSIFLGLLFSFRINSKIKSQIDTIVEFLDNINSRNYKYKAHAGLAKEFKDIVVYLKLIKKRLEKREHKKKKYTEKLKLLNRQRSELLSAISHEFKNPITVISGYSQTLINDSSMDRALQTKFLKKIDNSAKRLSSMIDRLSMATKFESDAITLSKTHFELYKLIEEAKRLLEDKYPNRDIVFEGESHQIEADKTMIEMVLMNLVDNALKYSEDEVRIVLKEGLVSVSDVGIGIAKEDLENITNKFYRTSGNDWDNSMGLGLYFVEYILGLHDTHLTIQSREGYGSTFSFKLKGAENE